MKDINCIIIDEITYNIIKDDYQERIFGLKEVGVSNPTTKIYHMLYKNNIITNDNIKDISILPIREIHDLYGVEEPDKVYSIIYKGCGLCECS